MKHWLLAIGYRYGKKSYFKLKRRTSFSKNSLTCIITYNQKKKCNSQIELKKERNTMEELVIKRFRFYPSILIKYCYPRIDLRNS